MAKINVNIRLDAELKKKAQILADKMWTNLSTIINMYLVKFVESWDIEYKKVNSKDIDFKKETKIKWSKNESKISKKIDEDNNSFLSAMI